MSDRKQARELMDAAGRDLSALRGMGDTCVFTDEVFGFHVQQAVEKYLKAWIALSGGLYPTTHDLADLLSVLSVCLEMAVRTPNLPLGAGNVLLARV